MTTIYQAAAYIIMMYRQMFSADDIDLLRLNKLLYFAKREKYMRDGIELFRGGFHAGQYGPVVVGMKRRMIDGRLNRKPSKAWIEANSNLIHSVLERYGGKSAISLSTLSHCEISWKNARDRSLERGDGQYEPISEDDIRRDAMKIKRRIERLGGDPVD